jgi:rare lipoprotein A (peptidoglycan hydrolase)
MRIAFAMHRLAGLRSVALTAALLGVPASFALPTTSAIAETGGASATAPASTAPASMTPAPALAPAEGSTTAGGAAATPLPSKPTLATWFGPGFYGHTTACGQTMSPALVGVASRTLACGTLVQIDFRGRQLTVPVLDRGPYGHIGAAWDLTAGAARALKIKETVRVTTAIVGSLPNTPSLGQPLEPSAPPPSAATSSAATSTTGGAAAS